MFSGRVSHTILMIVVLSLGIVAAVGCGAEATPAPTPLPTATSPADEPPATEVVEPATDTPVVEEDTEASAMEAAPEQADAVTGRARLRLAPVEGGGAVEIWVDDVVELYALDLELAFDVSKFQAADADPEMDGIQLVPGEVPAPDFVAVNSVDNETGAVHYVVTQLGTSGAFSGSGLVATLNWQEGVTWQGGAEAEGELSFGSVILVNQDVQQIDVTTK